MTTISIIGGHGKIALQAARLLSQSGHTVRSLIRNPDQAADVEATGAEAVITDIERVDTAGLAEALRGSDAIVWSAGAGGGNPERTYAVDRDAAIRSFAAAAEAGVSRYVLVSYLGAGPDHGVPEDNGFFAYAEAKAAADAALRATELEWTILAPPRLLDTPATGRITVLANNDRTESAEIPRDDVAAVIQAVLLDPRSHRTTIGFTSGDTPIAAALDQALAGA